MRRFLAVTAIASIGAALGGCTEDPLTGFNAPPSNTLAYEPPGAVSRTPLAPPSGYAAQQPGYGPSPSYGGGQGYGAPPPGGYAPPPPGYGAQSPGYGAPPGGYAPPPPASGFGPPPSADSRPPYPPPSAPYGNGYNPYGSTYNNGSYAPRSAAVGGWQTSPRWSAVQGNGCVIVEQDGGAGGTHVRNCANTPRRGQSAAPAPRAQPGADAGADAADDAPVDVPSRGDDAGGY